MSRNYFKIIGSVNGHPRYQLRLIAIGSAASGMVLAFSTLMVALHERRWDMEPTRVLIGVSLIPLGISILWHHFDLLYRRAANCRRGPPPILIYAVDGLGLSIFFGLMVVNGLMAEHLHLKGMAILLTYNQCLWMVCCAVHGILAFQQLHFEVGPCICGHCRREAGSTMAAAKRTSRGGYVSLIEHRESDDGDALESNLPAVASPISMHGDGA